MRPGMMYVGGKHMADNPTVLQRLHLLCLDPGGSGLGAAIVEIHPTVTPVHMQIVVGSLHFQGGAMGLAYAS